MQKNKLKLTQNEISFVVMSCDKYSDLWDIFFKSFFKYWPDCPYEVFLVSNFKAYNSKNVNSIKIGEDSDYGTNLNKIVREIPTEWFIMWFEDSIFSEKINTELVKKILSKAQDLNAGSCLLIDTYPVTFSKNKEDLISEIPKGVKYRSAIGASLYNKKTFIKLIEEGKSAWELDKNNKSNQWEDIFLALTTNLKKPILPHKHGVIKGKWCYGFKSFLKKEGFEYLIDKREEESLFSYLIGKIYHLRLSVLKKLKIHWYE